MECCGCDQASDAAHERAPPRRCKGPHISRPDGPDHLCGTEPVAREERSGRFRKHERRPEGRAPDLDAAGQLDRRPVGLTHEARRLEADACGDEVSEGAKAVEVGISAKPITALALQQTAAEAT